jgi:pimeloyl-ACP methyl ester carboxylesterase
MLNPSDKFPYVAGVTHRYVPANGLAVHVAEAGQGEPLLLLHGWPQHWYMWRYEIPALAERYHVICPDLRGQGWTSAPFTGYGKQRLVDDTLALLDALHLPRVRLMGHDWGGWIGFLLCLREPARVQRYLALNVAHPYQALDGRVAHLWRTWYQFVIAAPLLGARLVGSRAVIHRALRSMTVNKHWATAELDAFADRLRDPARARASVLLYRTFVLREALPALLGWHKRQRLTTPTLMLFGMHDPAIRPPLLAGYEPHADDFRMEFVPDAGHGIAEDKPQLVTQRALEFFAEAERVPAGVAG